MDNEVKKTGVVEKTPPTWAERVLKKSGVALLEATCLGCGATISPDQHLCFVKDVQ